MVSTDEVKEIQAYLDQYDWFHVREEMNGKLIREFYASGVALSIEEPIIVRFERLFADDFVIEEKIIGFKIFFKGKFLFLGKDVSCNVEPLHKKDLSLKKCTLKENFLFEDFINNNFFKKVEDEKRNIYYLLDMQKLGSLNIKQYERIKYFIDKYFEGRQNKYQFCRLPAFSKSTKNKVIINGHLYSLDTKKFLNTIELTNIKG